jgi:hypothetical protein
LLEEPGAWTLTVPALVRDDSPSTQLRGPWVFHFNPLPVARERRATSNEQRAMSNEDVKRVA